MAEKQEEITGGGLDEFKPPKLKAVEDAAEELRDLVAKRLKAAEKEDAAAEALQKVMHKNEDKLTFKDADGNPGHVYFVGEKKYIAVLKRSEEKVSVRLYKPPKKD